MLHAEKIANSEHIVNGGIRYLRCAFARVEPYHLAMKLKLRELRELNGWTQDEVASRVGMSKSYYSEVESGKKAANSQRLKKFAEVFNVPTFELIDDSSVDAELLDHLRTMQALSSDDRKAVMRHALGLAAGSE